MNATYLRTLCWHSLVFILCLLTTISYSQDQTPVLDASESETMPYLKFKRQKDDPISRIAHEKMMIENPYTHEIPNNISEMEHIFGHALNAQNANKRLIQPLHSPWLQRGPYNVGGRTRALAIDRNNEKIIFAGGVAGGLWRSIDAGETWVKVTTPTDRQGITCIVQDPRIAYANTWYYGAGEVYGNSTSGGGATYRGNGIFKSTDNGVTWHAIEATESNPTEQDGHFQFVNKIDMDTEGNLYAAHAEGISISKDGGDNWEKVLGDGRSIFTEITVGADDIVYATLANDGIYKSKDLGETWDDITPDALKNIAFQRVVIDISPSNPNKAIFFVHSPSKGVSSHMLFEYLSNENFWKDLTSNLPTFGGYVGNMSQGSYNQFVKYKPDNESVVFIGSTNVYRSNNAFRTTTETKWIGGYSTENNVSIYEGHHPDNHELIFLPSNANHVLSAHDGGLSYTDNIMAEEVAWEYINNGYYTTQSYGIAIPEKNFDDTRILAGFQDNGKWLSSSSDVKADWIEEYGGGDGCYVAIVSDQSMRYTSTQYGKILRFEGDDPRNPTGYDGIQPKDASGQLFVNPFLLDHTDENMMYYPSGKTLWVNTDLKSIRSGYTFNGTRTGWSKYNFNASGSITALDVSTEGSHRLYVGTNTGKIYKIDEPENASSTAVIISTDKGLPSGYVSCLAVNPKDDQHVIAVFSNYQIPSLFESKDAGETWENISGNLEENEDGSGAGPSIRWFAFHQPEGKETSYFVGTSIGLFHSEQLSSSSNWVQQAQTEVGDAVVGMIKTREDGWVVIGTHSNGIFTSYYGSENTPPLVKNQISDQFYYQGDQTSVFDLSNLFEDHEVDPLTFSVSSENPDVMTASIDGTYLYISPSSDNFGQSKITITANDGQLTSSMQFNSTVGIISPTLYEQSMSDGKAYRSQYFTDFESEIYAADDFEVGTDLVWDVSGVKIYHQSASGKEQIYRVIIWEDDNGKPSNTELFNSGDVDIQFGNKKYLTYHFPENIDLPEGKYWLTVAAVMSYRNEGSYYWKGNNSTEQNGSEFYFIDKGDLYRRGYTEWTSSTVYNYKDHDLAFEVFGRSKGGLVPSDIESLSAKLDGKTSIKLDWQIEDKVSGFIIERSISPDLPFVTIAQVNADQTSYVDNALKNEGATYYYKVRAFSAEGESENSPIASVRVTSTPNPVHHLEASYNLGGFQLNWEDKSNDEDHFIIEYSLNEFSGYVPIQEVSRNLESYHLTNVQFGSLKYYFRVAAVNGAGKSTYAYATSYSLLERPTSITIEETSQNSLQISWRDNSALETGFLLEYSTDAGVSFSQSFTTDVNQTLLQLKNLIPFATYYFKLSAINGLHDGKLQSTPQLFVYTMSGDSIPAAPQNLQASVDGSTSVEITWEDVITNELGFSVYRKEALSNSYEKIAELPYNNDRFVDQSVKEGEVYEYKVASFNHLGDVSSNVVSAEMGIHLPKDFELMRLDGKHYLKWTDSSTLENSYCVFRKNKKGSFVRIASLPPSTTQFMDDNVVENNEYQYYVAATYLENYYCSPSLSISTYPLAPEGLTNLNAIEETKGMITVSWNDLKQDGDQYKIYRKMVGNDDSTLVVTVSNQIHKFIDNTILAGKQYYYYITEFNKGVAGATISSFIRAKDDTILPQMAGNFRVSKESKGLMLTWVDQSDNEYGYQIYRAKRTSGTVNQLVEVPPNTTYYYDNDVEEGQEYKYLLVAYNQMGYSPEVEYMYLLSDETEHYLTPPHTLKVLDILDHQKVTWRDNSTNEHGFRVYRSKVNSADTLLVGQAGENDQMFKDYEQLEEGDYHYWIKSYNSNGESSKSEHFVFTKVNDVTDITTQLTSQIKLFPNPSSGQFNLELPPKWRSKITIAIYSLEGKKVFEQEFSNKIISLNLNHLFTGQYILKVFDDEKSEHQMIVKH
ncbi:fibronectin type III domain-containing protein [Flammeovirga pacifica]|nr:fibronectin type III domain-containing protein [Flammeovirga pacifica]